MTDASFATYYPPAIVVLRAAQVQLYTVHCTTCLTRLTSRNGLEEHESHESIYIHIRMSNRMITRLQFKRQKKFITPIRNHPLTHCRASHRSSFSRNVFLIASPLLVSSARTVYPPFSIPSSCSTTASCSSRRAISFSSLLASFISA